MATPRYITPLELAVLAWPAAVRPEELGPGRTSLISRAAAGSGSLLVSGAAFDAHQVQVQILAGGEPGAATFRAWTDGLTWGDSTLTSVQGNQPLLSTAPSELTEGADTGLRLTFLAGTGAPSFAPGDSWTFTTRPVQAILAAILASSADLKSIICGPDGGGRYTGTITFTDVGLKYDCAVMGRLKLAERRGIDPQSADGKLYIDSDKRARARVIEVAEKIRHPEVAESGPVDYAPDVYPGTDTFGIAHNARRQLGAR